MNDPFVEISRKARRTDLPVPPNVRWLVEEVQRLRDALDHGSHAALRIARHCWETHSRPGEQLCPQCQPYYSLLVGDVL